MRERTGHYSDWGKGRFGGQFQRKIDAGAMCESAGRFAYGALGSDGMAWWLKSDEYYGPYFTWVNPDDVEEYRGLVGNGMSLSRPLSEKNVPKAARSTDAKRKTPKPDVFIVDYAIACSGRFKALVEEFEPGVHLFAPIKLQYHDGSPMEGDYYFFNCNVDLDCVLTDNQPEWFKTNRYGEVLPALKSIQKLTPLEISLSKPQIEGRHLWTGGPLGWNQLFVSDEFAAAMKKNRITGTQRWRECHEIDRPWVAADNMGPLLDKWKEFVAHGRNCEVGYI